MEVFNCRLWSGVSGQGVGLNTWDTVGLSFDGTLQYATAFDQIFRSQNSGFDWSQIDSPFTGLKYNDLAVSYSGHIIVLTNNINLFISEDSGNSWRTGVIPDQNNKLWNKASISKDGNVIATAGLNSDIFVSHNTGYNWFSGVGANSSNWSAISISAADGKYQIAGISGDTLWVSDNSGQNWRSNYVGKLLSSQNDPFYSNLSLSLLMTGGVDNFIDKSQYSSPVTATTGIYITGVNVNTQKNDSSPISEFYTFISGNNNVGITVENNSGQLNFSNQDFTIEFFYKFYNVDEHQILLTTDARGPSFGTPYSIRQIGRQFRWFPSPVGSTRRSMQVPEVENIDIFNKWYHIAFSKKQTTMHCFVDGMILNTGLDLTSYANVGQLRIGSDSSFRTAIFNICDFKITSGIAKYTSNFIPPGYPSNINNEKWEDIKVSEDGSFQLAISDKDVFKSNDYGNNWERINIKSWPNQFVNQQYLKDGLLVWSPDVSNNFYKVSSILGSHLITGSLFIEGYFNSGYLNFDWALQPGMGDLFNSNPGAALNSAGRSLSNNLIFSSENLTLLERNIYKKYWSFQDSYGISNIVNPQNYLVRTFLKNNYYVNTPGKYRFKWDYFYSDGSNNTRISSQDSGILDNILLPRPLINEEIKNILKDKINISKFDIPNPITSTLYSSRDSGFLWKSLDFSGISKLKFSENGKNQIILTQFPVFSESFGSIVTGNQQGPLISNDYGYTWATGGIGLNTLSSSSRFRDVIISNDGSIITLVGSQTQNTQNSGRSWINRNISNTVSIAGSFDAQYQIIAINQGDLRFSQNYGISFNTISNTSKNWQSVAMSANGQFITAATRDEYIYTISNLNLGSFTPKLNDMRRNWNNVNISPNGQYQVLVETNGALFVSMDYGNSWVQKDNIYNINYAIVTDDGEILIVNKLGCAYRSLDLGNTWLNFIDQNSAWKEIQISTNKQIIGTYFNNLKEINLKNFTLFNTISGISLESAVNSSGYGDISLNSVTGDLFIGEILVTGKHFQPGAHIVTGLLTGVIDEDGGEYSDGTYAWNINLQTTGNNNEVYIDIISGFKQATNFIEFIDSTGSGLQINDEIRFIDYSNGFYDISFFYNPFPVAASQFSSPKNLIDKLNSGALGLFSNYEQLLGVTGYLTGSTLELFSFGRTGANGNNLIIYRETRRDARTIKIKNRYFTGGETYRPLAEKWTGEFTINKELRIANSGFYNNRIDIFNINNIQDIIWEDNFSNWKVLTGLRPVGLLFTGELSPVNYYNNLNLFSGTTIIGKANSMIDPLSGFIIDIQKPRPYYITGNYAKYEVYFNNLIYTGTLEG
jgi:photosystem II stability/assembly factor-like uncharacterized protein